MGALDRLLDHEHMRTLMEGLGGFFLLSNTVLVLTYQVALGAFSLISVACGAILGLHAVCKLVLPICRRLPPPPHTPPGL